MEILFEFIFELLFEGGIEVSSNKKISKWIRYPLIVLVSLIFMFVTGIFFLVSVLMYNENIFGSIIFAILGFIFLIGTIIKLKNLYLSKK